MNLVTIVDRIDVLVTSRAKTSRIKPHLIMLRDYAEAKDLRMSSLESQLEEADAKPQNCVSKPVYDALMAKVESLERDANKANKIIASYRADDLERQRQASLVLRTHMAYT